METTIIGCILGLYWGLTQHGATLHADGHQAAISGKLEDGEGEDSERAMKRGEAACKIKCWQRPITAIEGYSHIVFKV